MKKIVLLTDYRGSFYSSMGSQEISLDVSKIKRYFGDNGYRLLVMQFCDVDFSDSMWDDLPVLYTSMEDPELYYKSYIEDIVLGLEISNAQLIPQYKYLRAHHNKVLQEIIRQCYKLDSIKNIESSVYGIPQESLEKARGFKYPLVVKPAAGASSTDVKLVMQQSGLLSAVSSVARVIYPRQSVKVDIAHRIVKKALKIVKRKRKQPQNTIVQYKKKYIIQEFIPDLEGDYKVLVYGDKYFVLRRENRKNDFRASGSGKFTWPVSLPIGFLDYAKEIFDYFNVPYISLDIAYNGSDYFLIEFQFIMFGTLTLEKSKHYFQLKEHGWDRIVDRSEIEKEFVRSVCQYLHNKE